MKTKFFFVLVIVGVALTASACSTAASRERDALARLTSGGNANVGKELIRTYGCQSCHTISGVPGARALVGPNLNGIRERAYIAGQLANTPENLEDWIQHPHTVNPRTVMPEMNVSEADSRDIAAYLYSLPVSSR